MPRVLVMWIDPMHLSAAEAATWVREECERLRGIGGVERFDLTRLRPASDAHAHHWDWLLDVQVEGTGCVDEPLFADWLRDLRLLGMRPVVVATDGRS